MSTFVALVVDGFTNGAVYGLIAVAFVLTYRVSRVVNIALGEFMVLAALLASYLVERASLPRYAAVLAGLLAVVLVADLFSRLVLRRAIAANVGISQLLLLTLSLGILLQGVMLVAFGRDIHSAPPWLPGDPLEILGVPVQRQRLLLAGAAIGVAVLLAAYFARTLHGKAMVACADDGTGASLVGVKVVRFQHIAFVVTAGIAALAGLLLIPVTPFVYHSGLPLALMGLVTAAFARLQHAGIALGTGVAIGILEQLVGRYLSSTLQVALVFLILSALLLARPALFVESQERA
jgi:branched-chain amino acid transport system permease protein